MNKSILSIILLIVSYISWSQTYNLTGSVQEISDAIGIPGMRVFLQNTTFGTLTDGKGNFNLAGIPPATYTLVVSGEGYTTYKEDIDIRATATRVVQLKESVTDLPQLIVETQSLSLGRLGINDIPGSVSYISKKDLKNYNYTNVNDVLKMVPGVNIQEEDGFGLRPNIGMRGSGLERSARITLMEDGILAAPAPYASPSAYYFPTMGRMSSIEVLKGSSQVRFGPFTTGGAINFMSTPIPGQLSSKIQLTGGSYGYRNLHAYAGDRYDRVGFLVETFQYGADGFKTLPGGQSTGFDKKDYQLKLSVNTKPETLIYQSLSMTAGQTTEDANETYVGLSETDFMANPFQRYAASQADHMLANQRRLSAQHFVEIPGWFNVLTTVYRNDFQRNWYKLQAVTGGRSGIDGILGDPLLYDWEYAVLKGESFSDTTNLKVRANNRSYYSQGVQTVVDIEFETGKWSHDLHISGRLHEDQENRFQWEDGYAMNNRVMKLVSAGTAGSQDNKINQARSFAGYAFYKLSMDNLSFTPGIRYENMVLSQEDFGKNDVERTGANLVTRENQVAVWLPGIGVNYAINNRLKTFGGIHRGFAPPGSKADTEPESSINYELGIRKYNSRIEGTIVLFYNDYQHMLGRDVAAAGGIGTGDVFNAGTAVTQGMELQAGMDLIGGNERNFSLPVTLSYTLTDAFFTKSFDSDLEQWESVLKGDKMPYVATHQFFMSTGIQHKRANLLLNTKYQSAVRTAPGQGSIPSHELVKGILLLDISSNFFLVRNMSFNLSVNNILNNHYAVARRPSGLRPGMPRAFNVGMKVNF
ncbi:MAG: TonB-dependent receptor [Cyclobacteriaceae bacterium]|nr:TonB-dependent receptor [Cyclobacteriaceae bacterium]